MPTVCLKDADGCSPLHSAAFKKHASCVSLLVAAGASLSCVDVDGS
jgi:ankyrin repeat protein